MGGTNVLENWDTELQFLLSDNCAFDRVHVFVF